MSAAPQIVKVSLTADEAHEIMGKEPIGSLLYAACNSIVSLTASVRSLSEAADDHEREAKDAQTQLKAAEEEIENLKADLRVASGVRS